MDWICRFGESSCGIEDIIAIFGFLAAILSFIGGVAFVIAYFRAAGFSKPVVEAQQGQIDVLKKELSDDVLVTAELNKKYAVLQEQITNRAKVDEMFAWMQRLVQEGQPRQEALTKTLIDVATSLQSAVETGHALRGELQASVAKGQLENAQEHRAIMQALDGIVKRLDGMNGHQ